MLKKIAELKVIKSADFWDDLRKEIESKTDYVFILDTDTSTDRYYTIAKQSNIDQKNDDLDDDGDE